KDEDSGWHEAPIDAGGELLGFAVLIEEVDDDEGDGNGQQEAKNGVRDERTAEEEVAEAAEEISQDHGEGESGKGEHVGGAVGVEGHAAGEEDAEHVDVGEQGQGDDEAEVFSEEELGPTDRFGEDGEGGAGADFAGHGGGGAQDSTEEAGQEHDGQGAVFDE